MSFSHQMEQKTLRQVVLITHTLKKIFFTTAIYVCMSLLFRQSKETSTYFDLYMSSLHFYRREKQINTVNEK